jgi:hypothetical protein
MALTRVAVSREGILGIDEGVRVQKLSELLMKEWGLRREVMERGRAL